MKFKIIALILILLPAIYPQQEISVGELEVTPESPSMGDSVFVSLKITNLDFEKHVLVISRFFVDGKITDLRDEKIPPRTFSVINFEWIATEGNHELKVSLTYYLEEKETQLEKILTIYVPERENILENAKKNFNLGNYEEAKKQFEEIKNQIKDEEILLEIQKYILLSDANIYFERGEKFLKNKDYRAALERFEVAKKFFAEANDLKMYDKTSEKISFCKNQLLLNKAKTYGGGFAILILIFAGVMVLKKPKRKKVVLPKYKPQEEIPMFEEKPVHVPLEKKKKLGIPTKDLSDEFLERCRKLLETEITDSMSLIYAVEEYKSLVEEFKEKEFKKKEEIEKILEECKRKIEKNEKKWEIIRRLEEIDRRCDAFMQKYQSREFLIKDILNAYNTYTLLQEKFENLRIGFDKELEKRVEEKIMECYRLIQDEIHRIK